MIAGSTDRESVIAGSTDRECVSAGSTDRDQGVISGSTNQERERERDV